MIRFAFLFVFFTTARSVKFQDCGSTAGQFDGVEVANCDLSASFCALKKGSNASFELHFTPNKITNRVVAVVHGVIRENAIFFPIPNPDVCSDMHSGITCPLAADVATVYHAAMPVRLNYPTISLLARWELKDEDDANIACVEIPISIK